MHFTCGQPADSHRSRWHFLIRGFSSSRILIRLGLGDVLVHSAGEIVLGQLAACFIVGAPIGFDALQVSGDDVLAFSYINPAILAMVCLRRCIPRRCVVAPLRY